jgi:hypothetical protein
MKSPRLLVIALLAVLTPAGQLRADPVAWSYSSSPASGLIAADIGGSGSVTLSGQPLQNAFGNSFIVVSTVSLSSTASPGTPDVMSTNGSYQLNVFIKDATSGQSNTLTFSGKLSGSFSSLSANLSNSFTALASQTTSLGSNTYTVTLDSFVPPGPPGALIPGAIGAFVSVTAGGGNPTPQGNSPEPSSLLLCSLGAAGCGIIGWRRRRVR